MIDVCVEKQKLGAAAPAFCYEEPERFTRREAGM